MQPVIVSGDLLQQTVDVIVNAWNRNLVPWWLLRPHGVSGAIKRAAGSAPFQELATYGPLAPGQAVWTGAGKLPYRGIIHVASITLLGRSDEQLIRTATRNMLTLAHQRQLPSIAAPLLGSGSGGLLAAMVQAIMTEECAEHPFDGQVVLVIYRAP